jgi:hypothetical protein
LKSLDVGNGAAPGKEPLPMYIFYIQENDGEWNTFAWLSPWASDMPLVNECCMIVPGTVDDGAWFAPAL